MINYTMLAVTQTQRYNCINMLIHAKILLLFEINHSIMNVTVVIIAKQHRQVTWRSTDGSQETGDVHSVSTRDSGLKV